MERCTASDEIIVSSDSSSKKYIVSFREVLPTCTCPSFAIGRNKAKARLEGRPIKDTGNKDAWCKHIDRVYNEACRWRGTTIIPGMCPQCSGKTEPMGASLPPANSPAPTRRKKATTVDPEPVPVTADLTSIEASLKAWTQAK